MKSRPTACALYPQRETPRASARGKKAPSASRWGGHPRSPKSRVGKVARPLGSGAPRGSFFTPTPSPRRRAVRGRPGPAQKAPTPPDLLPTFPTRDFDEGCLILRRIKSLYIGECRGENAGTASLKPKKGDRLFLGRPFLRAVDLLLDRNQMKSGEPEWHRITA